MLLAATSYNDFIEAGKQIPKWFFILNRDQLKHFIEDTFKILKEFGKKKQKIRFYKIFSLFVKKTSNMKFFKTPSFERTLSEDLKMGGEVGTLLKKSDDLGKELNTFLKKKDIDFRVKAIKAMDILSQSDTIGEELELIGKEKHDDFKKRVKVNMDDPILLESDTDLLFQKIKRNYESFKYIIGLFLALFDSLSDIKLFRLENRYFNRKHNTYSDLYSYPKWKSEKKKFHRKNLPCLEDYLKKNKSNYPGIYAIFEWVFEKSKAHRFRVKESHYMDEVNQDRIEEGYYAISENEKIIYIQIEELYKIQNDLFQLFMLLKWMGVLFQSYSIITEGKMP